MAPLICQLSRKRKRNEFISQATIADVATIEMGEKWSLSSDRPRSIFTIGRKIIHWAVGALYWERRNEMAYGRFTSALYLVAKVCWLGPCTRSSWLHVLNGLCIHILYLKWHRRCSCTTLQQHSVWWWASLCCHCKNISTTRIYTTARNLTKGKTRVK